MKGIVNVLKPPNMTSHDVVAFIRRTIQFKKVGHTGTLDPMAAGVLPVCVGKATKIVEKLQEDKKTYRAEITLGQVTDTQDCWGQVLETHPVTCSEEEFHAAIMSFVGDIDQIPPMFSALKVGGKKLVDLAREGKVVEREARRRTVFSIEIIDLNDSKAVFLVTCSKGTYIRTLCHDIGQKLGCGAHMSFLLRESSGRFNLEDALTLEEIRLLAQNDQLDKIFQPIEKGLPEYASIQIDEEALQKLSNGVKLNLYKFTGDLNLEQHDKLLVFYEERLFGLAQVSRDGSYFKVLMDKKFG